MKSRNTFDQKKDKRFSDEYFMFFPCENQVNVNFRAQKPKCLINLTSHSVLLRVLTSQLHKMHKLERTFAKSNACSNLFSDLFITCLTTSPFVYRLDSTEICAAAFARENPKSTCTPNAPIRRRGVNWGREQLENPRIKKKKLEKFSN